MSNVVSKSARSKLFPSSLVLVHAVATPSRRRPLFHLPARELAERQARTVAARRQLVEVGGRPARDNVAVLDETGANCGEGQSGLNWYLAGTFSGPVTRATASSRAGRTLIIPVINTCTAHTLEDPAAQQKTEAFVRARSRASARTRPISKLEIDGVAVNERRPYLEESALFSLKLPANNIFGEPAGRVLSPAVDAGYYVAVRAARAGTPHDRLPRRAAR